MKKNFVLLLMICALVFGKDPNQKKSEGIKKISGIPVYSIMNINNIAAWYAANGEQEHSQTGYSGVYYPRGTRTAIFSAGLMWGGLVKDGKLPELRVNGHSYSETTQPGAIINPATGEVQNPGNADVRIWRIRRDYAEADLHQDAAEFFGVSPNAVTPTQIQDIRNQYEKDWKEWPSAFGAPYYDKNDNGIYDPTFLVGKVNNVDLPDTSGDQPGLLDADQVIWYVFNDLAGNSPWQSPPIGVEVQNTVWAYSDSGALANSVFKKYTMVYKGTSTTPDTAAIKDMYFTHWSDPDLGDAGDDYAGCDTILQLGYVYNSANIDVLYQTYSLSPPAVGYHVLLGPIVPNAGDSALFQFKMKRNYKNISMASYIYFAANGMYNDPPFNTNGSIQWYNMMRGLPPTPQGPPPPPMIKNPTTGIKTSFWLSGNPVGDIGWNDGSIDVPGDRRMLQTCGPFTMSLGDTQEVIIALVGGTGSSAKSSITVMKDNVKQMKQFFGGQFPDVITEVKNNVLSSPQAFILYQNYPNPFNPATVISYAIPKEGLVTLKIYDALGRDVTTLVHEFKQKGLYTAEFDASKLSSGVYIYRLRSGEYSAVKKMMLLK